MYVIATWLFWTSPTKYDGDGVADAAVDGVASVRPRTIAAGSPPVSSIVRSSKNSINGRCDFTLRRGRDGIEGRTRDGAIPVRMLILSQVDQQDCVLFRDEPIETDIGICWCCNDLFSRRVLAAPGHNTNREGPSSRRSAVFGADFSWFYGVEPRIIIEIPTSLHPPRFSASIPSMPEYDRGARIKSWLNRFSCRKSVRTTNNKVEARLAKNGVSSFYWLKMN